MKLRNTFIILVFLIPFFLSCGKESTQNQSRAPLPQIQPGVGLGSLKIGQTYNQVIKEIGQMPSRTYAFDRLIFTDFNSRGIEILFSSGTSKKLSNDAVVIGIAAKGKGFYGKLVPGISLSAAKQILGENDFKDFDYYYFKSGIGIQANGPNKTVKKISIFKPY